jgi:hypothetical protein
MASEQKERDAVYNAKYYAAHRVAQQQQQQQQAAMMASAAQTASQADMSGGLCGNCNAAIGLLKDQPTNCVKAAAYLMDHGKEM